ETLSPHANYSETRDHYLRFGFLNQRAPNGLLNRTYIAEQIAFMWGDNSAPITHYFRQGWHLRNRVLFVVDDLEDTSINRTLAAALRLQLGTIDLDVVVVTRAGGSLEKEFTRFAHIWHLPAKIGGAKDDPHLQNNYARLRHALKGNPPQIGYIQADQDLHLLADLGDICAKNVLFSNASPLKFSQDLEQALAGGLDHILSASLAETDLKETALQQIDVTPTQGYAGNVLSAQTFAPETARRNEIRAKLDISDDAYVVVGSGSFSLENGIDFFGVVGARLATDWSRDRDLHFVWVGDGPKYANTNYFYANYFAELSGNPHLFQTVDNLELKEVLAASDVYLDTKRDGTASSTLSYAQKMGLATITMGRAHSEQMQDDKRKACRPFDLQEITSTLSELAETVVSDIGIEHPQSVETDFAIAFLGDLNACARSVGFKDLFVSRLLFNPAQRVLVVSGTSFLNKLLSAGLSPKQPSQVGQLKFRPRQLSRSNLPIGIKAALHVGGAIEYTARALNAELSASIFGHYDKVLWVLDGTQNEVAEIYRLGNLAEEILVANDTFISEMMNINPSIAAKMRFQKEVLS
ncbi:hypothetical protein, partial [Planktotalea sp.]|uniref:hypothetical protein n=1 Tax=Planktotalea sp. TaxID=2029877 RepID=UPI00329A11B0